MAKHGEFCWTEVASTDREKCKPFYENVFGWEFQESKNTGDEMVYLECNMPGEYPMGALYQMDPKMFGEHMPPPHFMDYVAVDDCDAAASKAAELGGRINFGPYDIPKVGKMAVIADPTGANFSIIKLEDNELNNAPPPAKPRHGSIIWYELATSDLTKAKPFYHALFGWTTEISHSDPMEYHRASLDGKAFGGMLQMNERWGDPMPPSHWVTYILVDNCDETIGKIEANGGKSCGPPFDVPGIGKIGTMFDPAGAMFAIIQPVGM